MKVKLFLLTVMCLTAMASSASAVVITYDANADLKAFELGPSGSGTPLAAVNGVWQYGTAPSIGGTFTQFAGSEHSDTIVLPGVTAGDLQGWQEDQNADLVPAIAVNVTSGNVASNCCGTYEVNEIWFHAGPLNAARAVAIVRWTAPSAGTIDYSATFIAESGQTTNSSFVAINGNTTSPGFSGFSSGSNQAGGTVATGTGIAVAPGTTIDFANGAYSSMGLFASIEFTPVPEPTTFALAMLGVVGLVGARRRTMIRK